MMSSLEQSKWMTLWFKRTKGAHMAANGHKEEEWSDAIDKARELLEQGRREMAKATEMAKEKGDDAWKSAQRRGQEAWQEAKVSGLHAWDDVQERGEEAWDDAAKLIRKHPSRSIGIALLVGVVIGALVSRDRD